MALEAILRGIINIEDVEAGGGQALYGNFEEPGHRTRSSGATDHGGRDSHHRMLSTFQTVAESVEVGLQDRAGSSARLSYLAGANARIQQVLARPGLETSGKDTLPWSGSRPVCPLPGSPSYKKQPSGLKQGGLEASMLPQQQQFPEATKAGAAAATAVEGQPQEQLSPAAALHQHLDRMGCNRFYRQQQAVQQQQVVQQQQQQAPVQQQQVVQCQDGSSIRNSSSSSAAATTPANSAVGGAAADRQGYFSPSPARQRCYTPNSSAMTHLTTSYTSTTYASMSTDSYSYSYDYGTSQSCNSSMSSSGSGCCDGLAWILPQAANTQVLAAYEFGRQLGVGTFGVTRLVRDRSSAAPAACKTICKLRVCANPTLVTDIQREVQILQHLTGHSNVVGLRGVYEDTRSVHLVLDLCTGGDLHDHITRCPANRMPEREAAAVTRSMLEALAFCHARGVIHRDVKPENFLLEAPGGAGGGVKVSDFGVSAFYQPGELLTELVGTPFYMAPEVIQRAYGPEADVWSVGVVAYLMLCGRLPFTGTTDRQVVTSVLYKEPDFSALPWQEVSQEAQALVKAMLVKDPRRRASISSLLARPWLRPQSAASRSSSNATSVISRSSSLKRNSLQGDGRRPSLPGALVTPTTPTGSYASCTGALPRSEPGSGRLGSSPVELNLLKLAHSGSSSSGTWDGPTAPPTAAAAAVLLPEEVAGSPMGAGVLRMVSSDSSSSSVSRVGEL